MEQRNLGRVNAMKPLGIVRPARIAQDSCESSIGKWFTEHGGRYAEIRKEDSQIAPSGPKVDALLHPGRITRAD